jgi:hypothetical protein
MSLIITVEIFAVAVDPDSLEGIEHRYRGDVAKIKSPMI